MKGTKKTVCTLTVNGVCIPYEFERKRIKRLNLRVREDGTVHLSAPLGTPCAYIEGFLREKAVWILEARARVLSAQSRPAVLQEGDALLLCGKSCTVTLRQGGRPTVALDGERLVLTVCDPTDENARIRAMRRFVKKEAAAYLTARVAAILPHFSPRPATFPQLSFRWMKTRWGSCMAAKNRIALNEKLLFVAPHLADYVILHELCHFAYQDHSAAFYRHLGRFCPDHVGARRELARAEIPDLTEH